MFAGSTGTAAIVCRFNRRAVGRVGADDFDEEIDDLLPNLAYAYGRHGLRMMVDQKSPTAKEELLRHGFTRVFEMKSN